MLLELAKYSFFIAVFSLKRLQNGRVDVIAEKHKLDAKLKNIEQKKGSYLEEMKEQLLVSEKHALQWS